MKLAEKTQTIRRQTFCPIRVCKVFDMRCSFWLVGGVCNPDFATHLSPKGAASM